MVQFEVPAGKKACRLVIRDGLLARLEVPVGGLAIRDATTKVVLSVARLPLFLRPLPMSTMMLLRTC